MHSVEENLRWYRQCYQVMAANNASEHIAKDLWQEWDKPETGNAGIENLILKARDFEAGFFKDIVTIAERMGGFTKRSFACLLLQFLP